MSAKAQKKKKLTATKSKAKAKPAAPAKKRKTVLGPPPRPLRVLKIVEDPRVKLAREQYEAAVGLLGGHKYDKAVVMFEKVLTGPSAELSERARIHLNICRQRMETRLPTLKTAEDHYNYAVAQTNSGKLNEAEEHLGKAMKLTPRTGHLHYLLAMIRALRGDIEGALTNLRQAIDLDAASRNLAKHDPEFRILYEDPRFADLVYPERMD